MSSSSGGRLILSRDTCWKIVECVWLCSSLFGAQMSPTGGSRALHPMFAGIVQVEMHLPSVGITKFAYLEVNNDQAAQAAVKKDEVDTKQVSSIRSLRWRRGTQIIAQLQEEVMRCRISASLNQTRSIRPSDREFENERILDALRCYQIGGSEVCAFSACALFLRA